MSVKLSDDPILLAVAELARAIGIAEPIEIDSFDAIDVTQHPAPTKTYRITVVVSGANRTYPPKGVSDE